MIQLEIEGALQSGGYVTVSETNGETAIKKLHALPDIRAVVTDINLLGKKTGWEVARKARERSPDIPVVYVSSVSVDEWSAQGVPGSQFVAKPFAPSQLVTAVGQLLNVSEPATSPTGG
jgi:CheY-like chemotaxis protein